MNWTVCHRKSGYLSKINLKSVKCHLPTLNEHILLLDSISLLLSMYSMQTWLNGVSISVLSKYMYSLFLMTRWFEPMTGREVGHVTTWDFVIFLLKWDIWLLNSWYVSISGPADHTLLPIYQPNRPNEIRVFIWAADQLMSHARRVSTQFSRHYWASGVTTLSFASVGLK